MDQPVCFCSKIHFHSQQATKLNDKKTKKKQVLRFHTSWSAFGRLTGWNIQRGKVQTTLGPKCSVKGGQVNASWVELNRTGNQPYLERCSRLWVHLDHRCNQNHSGKLGGPLACCQDGDGAALDGDKEEIYWFLFAFLQSRPLRPQHISA